MYSTNLYRFTLTEVSVNGRAKKCPQCEQCEQCGQQLTALAMAVRTAPPECALRANVRQMALIRDTRFKMYNNFRS